MYVHAIAGLTALTIASSSDVSNTVAFKSSIVSSWVFNLDTCSSGMFTTIMREKYLPSLAALLSPTFPPTSMTCFVMSDTIPVLSLPTALIIRFLVDSNLTWVDEKQAGCDKRSRRRGCGQRDVRDLFSKDCIWCHTSNVPTTR